MTVACVLVRGEVPYDLEYVRRLHLLCRRFLTRAFRFVCLTDRDGAMPEGVEAIRIPKFEGCWAFWSKMHLFNPALGLRGRVLYLDLDNLPLAPLDPIVDYPAPFALAADQLAVGYTPGERVKHPSGKWLVKRYNGGVMVWEGGEHADLFTEWRPDVAHRLLTDQDWVGERYPDAGVMPVEWFPRHSQVKPPFPPEAKVLFAKKPKPHEAVRMWAWFDEVWGGARA